MGADAAKSLRSSRSGVSRSQQKGWRKTVGTLKNAFFNMVCAMMKAESGERPIFVYLKIAIETVQHLAFSFDGFKWGPMGDRIGNIFVYSQFEDRLVESTSFTVQLALACLGMLVIILMIVDAIYVILSFFSKDFKAGVWPLRFLRILVSLLSSVLFLPIISSLQSIYSCPAEPNLDFFECYNTFHIVLIVICTIGIVILVVFTAIMALAFYTPDPHSRELEARPLPAQDVFLIIDKAVTLLLAERVAVYSHSFFAFYLICSSTLFQVMYLMRLPFYWKSMNKIQYLRVSLLQWAALIAAGLTFRPAESDAPLIVFCVGLIPVLLLHNIFFEWRYKFSTSKQRLLEAVEFVDNSDLEGQLPSEALMRRLKIRNPFDVTVLVRFVWRDPTPEDVDLADTLFQFSLQYFMDENQNKIKRPFSFGNSADSRAFLCQQYGMFLMICKGDLTTSQLYFKRAQQMKPYLITEFVTFEAEKDRKERVLAQERGGGIKMDIVDRVEYRQLLKQATLYHRETGKQTSNFWKALAMGNPNITTIISIFSKMERAEKDAHRYYRQLMSKFSYMPKVLQQYADFLDLTNEVNNADNVRMDLREIMEEQENVMSQNDLGNDVMSQNGRTLSFAQYAQTRRGTMSTVQGALPSIFRTMKEKRALIVYGRVVTNFQEHYRKMLSTLIGIFCIILFAILTAEVLSAEVLSENLKLSVNQVHQSGNMSLWSLQIPFFVRQMQLETFKGNLGPYQFFKPIVTSIIDSWENTRESLYFDNNLIDYEFTKSETKYLLFTGLDTFSPFIPIDVNILEAARSFGSHATELLEEGVSYLEKTTQFPMTVGNITIPMTIPAAIASDKLRMVMDNMPSLVLGYDNITDTLTRSNEKEIGYILYVFGSLIFAWTIALICMGLFVFYPTLRWLRKQRSTVMNAFLQIPQEISFEMYIKYRFEKAPGPGEGDADDALSDTTSDNGENSDSDDEEQTNGKLVLYGSSTSRFKQIVAAYTWALLYLFVLFSADVAGSAIWLRVTMADAGRLLQRSAQLPFFAQGFVHLTTELIVKDPFSPIGIPFIKSILLTEIELFESHRYALMYGNTSLGLPPRKLKSSEQDFFFEPRHKNKTKSIDTLSNEMVADVRRLILLETISPVDPAYLRLREASPIVVRAFTDYANTIKYEFNNYHGLLTLWSTKIMFPLVVFFLIFTYFRFFQKIFSMMMDEGQKTVRLLLLIPLKWASQKADIKNLLDIDPHELDVPEIRALTGSADEDKLNELILKHTNPYQERSRSSSDPVQSNTNLFDEPLPSDAPEENKSQRSSTGSRSSRASSKASKVSSTASKSSRSVSSNGSNPERRVSQVIQKPKFGSLRQFNGNRKVHPDGDPAIRISTSRNPSRVEDDGNSPSSAVSPPLKPSLKIHPPLAVVKPGSSTGLASPRLNRNASVSFGNVVEAPGMAAALTKSEGVRDSTSSSGSAASSASLEAPSEATSASVASDEGQISARQESGGSKAGVGHVSKVDGGVKEVSAERTETIPSSIPIKEKDEENQQS